MEGDPPTAAAGAWRLGGQRLPLKGGVMLKRRVWGISTHHSSLSTTLHSPPGTPLSVYNTGDGPVQRPAKGKPLLIAD